MVRRALVFAFSILAASAASAQTASYLWMSPDVGLAWSNGYSGRGSAIVVVDSFNSSSIRGNLDGTGSMLMPHGGWTYEIARAVAPQAVMNTQEWSSSAVMLPNPKRLISTINLSYGMFVPSKFTSVTWSAEELSIVSYANKGSAIVVKAAGNDGVAMGRANSSGMVDVLNSALKLGATTIYAGALSSNGTPTSKARLAWYSNIAGTDLNYQSRFLVVGVLGDKTGLYGTSFAAPIISGYSAIVAGKFHNRTPTQIANQLLATARQDTLVNYNPAIYGRGEASLSRALAPATIK